MITSFILLNLVPASITKTLIPFSANVRAAIPPVAPEPTTIASKGLISKT